MILDIKHTKM